MWWSFNHHILEAGEQIAFRSIKSDKLLKSLIPQEYSPESWAATPITLLATWSLINRLQPSYIVEFGSGTSTCIFAKYAEIAGRTLGKEVRIVSIDHDQDWLSHTDKMLSSLCLGACVDLIRAPITDCIFGPDRLKAYDPTIVAEAIGTNEIDFCFIDGPPGSIGRDGCLPLVSKQLSSRAVILMDDAARLGEQSIMKRWKNTYHAEIASISGILTSRGLFAINWSDNPTAAGASDQLRSLPVLNRCF
jgi:predicted O-methyltransferase YrrM